jgi:hypothetical protein
MTIMPPLLTAILKASTVCSKDLLLGMLTRASCARADVAASAANRVVSKMEKNQNTDPFKFIIYSAKAGEQTPQINPEDVKKTGGSTR